MAHVFGGEDQAYRITFRGDVEDVMAFEHLGPPYFRTGWGRNVIGMLLDERTDWERAGRAAHRLLLPPGSGNGWPPRSCARTSTPRVTPVIDAVIFDWGGTLTRWHDIDFHAESLALAQAVVDADHDLEVVPGQAARGRRHDLGPVP